VAMGLGMAPFITKSGMDVKSSGRHIGGGQGTNDGGLSCGIRRPRFQRVMLCGSSVGRHKEITRGHESSELSAPSIHLVSPSMPRHSCSPLKTYDRRRKKNGASRSDIEKQDPIPTPPMIGNIAKSGGTVRQDRRKLIKQLAEKEELVSSSRAFISDPDRPNV
jgi:hypothetical protein